MDILFRVVIILGMLLLIFKAFFDAMPIEIRTNFIMGVVLGAIVFMIIDALASRRKR